MTDISNIILKLNDEQAKYGTTKSKTQATKVRASLLELKKACDAARRVILEESKEIPTKTRTKKLVLVDTEDEVPPPPKLEREVSQRVKTKTAKKAEA